METTRVPFAPQGDTLKYGYTKGHLVMEQEQPQQLLQQQRMLQQQQQMLQQQQQQQLQLPQQSQDYQEMRQQDSLREQQYEQEQRQCSQQQRQQQQQQQSQKGYSTCGGDEGVLPSGPLFVEKMSLLMKQLATSGDEANGRPSVATRFDSICPPATSIAAYIPRLYRHFRCSEEVFVFALIYLDRVIRANHIRINALNIHRLVLAASVVGVKFVEDVRYSNRYYARVGGVSLTELNRLELAFLKLVKFDLMVSKEEYAVYRSTVLLACPWRPVSSVPQVEAEEQQQQQQHFVGAADTRVGGVDCRNSLMGPTDQQNYGDAQIPVEQQGRLYALVQQQQQQQQQEQRHHEQQQHCLSGVVATSTASTVSTTPEAGPPNLPSGTSFGSSAGAVVAAAVAAADLIQQHQLDRLMESLQRTEVSSQEEALMRCPLQQQWQSCGVQYVGAYEQQHPQQQQLSMQQTRLMLQAQAQQAQSQQQQKVSKQQSRLCSPERLLELQHQHHRQMIVHSSCCCCGSIIISSSCCWSSSSNSN